MSIGCGEVMYTLASSLNSPTPASSFVAQLRCIGITMTKHRYTDERTVMYVCTTHCFEQRPYCPLLPPQASQYLQPWPVATTGTPRPPVRTACALGELRLHAVVHREVHLQGATHAHTYVHS